jgi:hypothetical protein
VPPGTSRLDAGLANAILVVGGSGTEDDGANTPSPPDSPGESLASLASQIAERETANVVKKRLLFENSAPIELGKEGTELSAEVAPPDALAPNSTLMSLLRAPESDEVTDSGTAIMEGDGMTAKGAAPLEPCAPPSVAEDGPRVPPQLPKTWSSQWPTTDTQKGSAMSRTLVLSAESMTQLPGNANTTTPIKDAQTPKEDQHSAAPSQTKLAKDTSGDTDRKRAKALTPKEPSVMRTPVKESNDENGQKRKHTQQSP